MAISTGSDKEIACEVSIDFHLSFTQLKIKQSKIGLYDYGYSLPVFIILLALNELVMMNVDGVVFPAHVGHIYTVSYLDMLINIKA